MEEIVSKLYDPFTAEEFDVIRAGNVLSVKDTSCLCMQDDLEQGMQRLACRSGLVLHKPRCTEREGTVIWQITKQVDDAVTAEFFTEGARHTMSIRVPGLTKNLNIDILRDAVNLAIQSYIKSNRLVGLAGSFKDTSLSKLNEKVEKKEDKTDAE